MPPQRTAMAAIVAALALRAADAQALGTPLRWQLRQRLRVGKASTVTVALTPKGLCAQASRIPAVKVTFNVPTRCRCGSRAELRTRDLTPPRRAGEPHLPGCPGASPRFQPGATRSAAGARGPRAGPHPSPGKATGAPGSPTPSSARPRPVLQHINQNVARMVTTAGLCRASNDGSMTQAKRLYPKARFYSSRIEPVGEIWGSLDTDTRDRWENPSPVASQFTGFHKIDSSCGGTHPGPARRNCVPGWSGRAPAAHPGAKAQYTRWRWPAAPPNHHRGPPRRRSAARERYSNTDSGLPGQRGRGHEGRRPAPALPAAERPGLRP